MLTKMLASKINRVRYETLPPEVITTAKQAVIDSIGVAIAASDAESIRILKACVYEEGGKEEASILCSGQKVTAQNAALVNTAMAHVLDYDDVSWSIIGHPAIVSFFPALALAEKLDASGKDILEAFVAGYETVAAIGRGLCPEFCAKGWHSTATIGTFGAAVAAGKLLKLSDDKMTAMLGMAGSMAAGVKQNMGTMTKHLHAGNASFNGIRAALLAAKGFTSTDKILEGKDGFSRVYADQYDFEAMQNQFCNPFDLVTTGALFKKWPSCYSTHPCIEAMIALTKEHNLKADEIEAISIVSTKLVNDVLFYHSPQTGLQGKFSNHFCAALAVVKGRALNEDFVDEVVRSPEIQRLMQRVEMHIDENLSDKGYIPSSEEGPTKTRVTVTLKTGEVYRNEIAHAKGSPQRRLSHNEVVDKYRDCVQKVLGSERTEACLETLETLENLPSISALMDLFTART